MNSDDLIAINGHTNVAIYYMLNIFVESVCYGAATIAFGLAMSHLWPRISSARSTKILFTVLAIQLILVSFDLVFTLITYVLQLRRFLLFSTTLPVAEQYMVSKSIQITIVIATIAKAFPIQIGTAVIVWRAWVLYSRDLWVHVFLAACWICGFFFSVGYWSVITYYSYHNIHTKDPLLNHLGGVEYFFRLAVNLAATGTIVWKAWKHRSLLKGGGNTPKTAVMQILLSLVECGAALAVVQLAIGIPSLVFTSGEANDPGFIAITVLRTALNMLDAVYPALIVLVLSKRQSFIDNSTFPVPSGPSETRIGEPSTIGFTKVSPDSKVSDATYNATPWDVELESRDGGKDSEPGNVV